MRNLQEEILRELTRGDKFPYQLFDNLKPHNYQELWAALAELQKQGEVEPYFTSTYPSPTLTFRLTKSKPMLALWKG